MSAATKRRSSTSGRMPPAPRGRPYFDADRGQRMIVPAGGGKAIPYVGRQTPSRFDARGALRRTGILAPKLGRELVDDAARGATFVADRQPFNLGAAGGLVIAFFAGLAGLIFLDLLLSERGSRAGAGLLASSSRALSAFASPNHPLFVKSPPGNERVAPTAEGRARQAAVSAGAPPTSSGSSSSKPMLRPAGTEWGGSKSIADRLANVAIGAGELDVSSTKRDTKATASGGVSDHWVGSTNAYAYDLAGTVAAMDRAARALMAALGVSWDGGEIVENVRAFGYRVQVLYRTNVGGNHYDHIHIGVRKET